MYIDTHCHIDMFKNPKQVLRTCENKRIITIGVTNLPSHFEMGFSHVQNLKYIRFALGLHPLLTDKHDGEHIRFKRNVGKTSYIGEVGLDFSKEGISTKNKQIESFEFVLNEIEGKKKVVSLHSRRAEVEVLTFLKKYKIETAIFHWYSGTMTTLKKIVECGYYFSVNTAMITSQSGRKILSQIPSNLLLTETDAPYTTLANRTTKPEDVKYVIKYIAQIYKRSEIEIENLIYNNFNRLINKIR
ncbi:Qat anti-phage system TatD family nuclease QatD [Draconibacterium sediminis]|uniref:Qat anti-phage system TatD family nuclease QatD n=1 Tax=Draconibacterium sediminis TaxID=1544798 RepID=UPI0026ED94AB|nr:Qat anti-phage system TatD family nuclease QatD [Draconibacterium sediminis]